MQTMSPTALTLNPNATGITVVVVHLKAWELVHQ